MDDKLLDFVSLHKKKIIAVLVFPLLLMAAIKGWQWLYGAWLTCKEEKERITVALSQAPPAALLELRIPDKPLREWCKKRVDYAFGEKELRETLESERYLLKSMEEELLKKFFVPGAKELRYAQKLLALGKQEPARKYLRTAIVYFQQAREGLPCYELFFNLGAAYDDYGARERAVAFYNMAIQKKPAFPEAYYGMGISYLRAGAYPRAMERLVQAYEAARDLRVRQRRLLWEARSSSALGALHYEVGEAKKAVEAYQRALKAYRTLGDPGGAGDVLNCLGQISRRAGDIDRALEFYRRALDSYQGGDYNAGEGGACLSLADLYTSMERFEEALVFYKRARELKRRASDTLGEGEALLGLGNFMVMRQAPDRALNYYRRALGCFEKIAHSDGRALVLAKQGQIFLSRDKLEKALACQQEAARLFRRGENRWGEASVLVNMGKIYYKMGNMEKAHGVLSRARDFFEQVKMRHLAKELSLILGE